MAYLKKLRPCRADGCTSITRGIEGYCNRHRELSFNRRFKQLKLAARKHNTDFNITLYNYERLLEANSCEYCGGPLPITGHGLDRVDSNGGYTLDNVVPCCYSCNMTKSNTYSYDQMKMIAEFINEMKLTNWQKAKKEKKDGV